MWHFLEGECAHIILIDDVEFDGLSLLFEEIPHPKDVAKFIVNCNQFGTANCILSEGHETTGVAKIIIVSLVQTVDIPEDM
jgi:hypothetical protein